MVVRPDGSCRDAGRADLPAEAAGRAPAEAAPAAGRRSSPPLAGSGSRAAAGASCAAGGRAAPAAACARAQAEPAQPAASRPPLQRRRPRPIKYVVQVGSKKNQTEALASFADMQQKYPSLLANYRPIVQKADLGAKGTWYRLRIGPIADKTAASKLCSQLKSQGLPDCLVMAQ